MASRWIFLAGCPLFWVIIYLGIAGDVAVSELDDSVSEHEELVTIISTTGSSGAGFVVLLDAEGSDIGLGSPWKGKHIPV